MERKLYNDHWKKNKHIDFDVVVNNGGDKPLTRDEVRAKRIEALKNGDVFHYIDVEYV